MSRYDVADWMIALGYPIRLIILRSALWFSECPDNQNESVNFGVQVYRLILTFLAEVIIKYRHAWSETGNCDILALS